MTDDQQAAIDELIQQYIKADQKANSKVLSESERETWAQVAHVIDAEMARIEKELPNYEARLDKLLPEPTLKAWAVWLHLKHQQ